MKPTPLLERQGELAVLRALLDAAPAHGSVALVAGEAGIGKTSLVRAATAAHAGRGGTVWWGACDALQTPHPLAPLLDIAREAGPRFALRLEGPRAALFEAVLDELRHAPAPVFMVVEDAHWADDATLDLLKYLGRRIDRTRAVLVITYRDDEVTLSHPLRRVLGELPMGHRSLIDVPRLSPEAVAGLARHLGADAQGVHAASGGNAFFATELLRAGHGTVPRSVKDLVLSRFASLPAPVKDLLRAVAVLPGRAERALVDALVSPHTADLDAALASGLLVMDGPWLAYRHELARVAVESALSAAQHQAWHGRVLAALTGPDAAVADVAPARLVHHAVRALDVAAVSRHGPRAAEQALARGSLREAASLWQTTLAQGRPADVAEEERWLEAAHATLTRAGRHQGRDALCERLEAIARERGDLARAAAALARRALCGVARNDHAGALAVNAQALALVEALPDSADKLMVWRGEAYLRMLDRDCAVSLDWAHRALALADALKHEAERHLLEHIIGCDQLLMGHASGQQAMQALADRHLDAGRRAEAAGVLSNLGSGAGEVMRFDVAEPALRETLAIAQALEMDGAADYGGAWLALCRLQQGDWAEAGDLAMAVSRRPGVSDMSRLMALLALARLRVRRGDPEAGPALDDALRLVGEPGTLQRLAPTRAARAEWAFARGDLGAVRAEVAAALPLARAKGHPWFIGELGYWGWRAGAVDAPVDGAAEPWALQMQGRWREAAAAWAARSCPYEQARALADGDAAAQREALALAERLGAAPLADGLRRALHQAGERGVPRGPRASTQAHPAGLTAAEQRVLVLLADGLRNADIAARLHRSVRTVDHQVASVLAKLGAASRTDAVERARRDGWLGAD